MTSEDNPSLSIQSNISASNVFAEIIQFLHAVRMRKGIVFSTLVVSGLLSTLYYLTATRQYDSRVELYLIQNAGESFGHNSHNAPQLRDQIPTHRKILMCDVVLQEVANSLSPEFRNELKGIPKYKWSAALRENLYVHSDRLTSIISVRYRSQNPKAAAAVVNGIADAYLNFINDTHKDSAREQLNVLTTEKSELEKKLRTKELDLLELRDQFEDIIGPDGKSLRVIAFRVSELNKSLVESAKRSVAARSFLKSILKADQNGEDIHQLALQTIQGLGSDLLRADLGLGTQDIYTITRIEQQLNQDRAKLNSELTKFRENHPNIISLQGRIRQSEYWLTIHRQQENQKLREIRKSELKPRLIQMARQRVMYAAEHEHEIRQQFENEKRLALSLNKQNAKVDIVKLDLEHMRAYRDLLFDRIKDVDLKGNFITKAEVISPPKVSNIPVSPRLVVVALVCAAIGLGSGLVIVYVLDTLDDRFRSPEELRIQLGVPVLAMVGQMKPLDGEGIDSIHTFTKPNSVETEAFRTLRTALSFNKTATQRIVTTSTEPGDGKTTILVNLATAFAQAGKRTLIIDADMRRPGLTAILNLKGPRGLSQVLRDAAPITESCLNNLYHTVLEGLDVLPSGPRPINPAELLTSDRFSELLAWAETIYDQILIDSPPALAVSDPVIMGRMVDGVLLVVRPDINRRRMVIRAAETFDNVDVSLLGVVVNHLTPNSGQDYYGYGYGYRYEHSYEHSYNDDENRSETDGEQAREDLIENHIDDTYSSRQAA